MNVDFSGIEKNSTVAIAVSGGSDSMALLHYAENLKNRPFNVIAINVEHGIRGTESIEDSNFVATFCKNNGIPLLFYAVDCLSFSKENKMSLEESARKLRYQCFRSAISEKKCDYVATAHHMRDNAETVLFNIFRGTGIKGLSGITNHDKIIRPLLNTKKEEIEDYIRENNIPYVDDSTNFSPEYSRNFIRLELLPKIKERFPEAESCILRLSKIAEEQSSFIESEAKKLVSQSGSDVILDIHEHDAVMRTGVVLAMQTAGLKKDWQKVNIDSIIALKNNQTGKTVTLPKGITATKQYDKIVFSKEKHNDDTILPFSVGNIAFCDYNINIEKVAFPKKLTDEFYVDFDKIPNNAVIRTRQSGDFIYKFGGNRTLVSDYFTDKKIPLTTRKNIPLLANGKEVLAIFGYAISNNVKIDNSTKTVIKLSLIYKQ